MDTTRTLGAGARSRWPLIFIAVALAIVLSMAVVNASTHQGSTGGQQLSTAVAPIAAPKSDPAAEIHLRVAAGLAKLSPQKSEG